MPTRLAIGFTLAALLSLSLAACQSVEPQGDPMDEIAESFVKLVLAVGQHDVDYVDAYFGPENWRTEAQESAPDLEEIRRQAAGSLEALRSLDPDRDDELAAARHLFMGKSLESLIARVDLLSGVPMTFDRESAALYDAVAPTLSAEHFQEVLDQLETTEIESPAQAAPYAELFPPFVFLALIIMALEQFLSATRFRRYP